MLFYRVLFLALNQWTNLGNVLFFPLKIKCLINLDSNSNSDLWSFLYNLINIISYFSHAKCISSQWHQYTNLFYLTTTYTTVTKLHFHHYHQHYDYLLKHVAFVFVVLVFLCISHKGYPEKLLCFKVTYNSFSLMNVYAAHWFHFTSNF